MRLKQFPDTSRSQRLREKLRRKVAGHQRSEKPRAAPVDAVMQSQANITPLVRLYPNTEGAQFRVDCKGMHGTPFLHFAPSSATN